MLRYGAMIKKLRKFNNITLLCITDDVSCRESIKVQFADAKKLIFIDSVENEFLVDGSFDVLLIDYDVKNFTEIINKIKLDKPLVPRIIFLRDSNEDDIAKCINTGAYSILANPINFDDLRLSIIMALNQSKRVDKISLKNGVYYDSYREKFYNKNGILEFTKFEFQLLKLLLDNHGRITSYDEIHKKVWKDKNMSIFTMRNVVNKIRNKTYYEIIKNNSSSGYVIDNLK